MSEAYAVKLARRVVKEVRSFQPKVRRQIGGRLEQLRDTPRPHDAKHLRGRENAFRIDSGEYRILYDIDDSRKLVEVWRIGHRKDVYRNL